MTIPRKVDGRRPKRDNYVDYGGGLLRVYFDGLGLSGLLDIIGYRDNEFVALAHKLPDGAFRSEVCSPVDVRERLAALPDGVDIYFGVNPVAGPARQGAGRGKAEDVTRLAALVADLDVKDGACPTLGVAEAIVNELSEVLGMRPAAVTRSGGGLHPYWPVTDGEVGGDFDAAALLRRWGRLVKAVAKSNGASADSVFDLARVLRVPGSVNHKPGVDGAVVTCERDRGSAQTIAQMDERLRAAGVDQTEVVASAEQAGDPNSWVYADETCAYVRRWIDSLDDDGPVEGDGRHQWVLSEAVRFACARMLGCVSEADYERAEQAVAERLTNLRAETGESVPIYEVPAAWGYGLEVAAAKTLDEASAEVGNHKHAWPAPDAPRDVAARVVAEIARVGRPWRYWNGMWFVWCGTHYEQASTDQMRDDLYELLGDATYLGAKGVELRWKPNQKRLNEVLDATRGLVRLPEGVGASGWIDGRKEQVIPCANGLLRMSDRLLLEHTPDHFSIMSLPYCYEANAVCPRWEQFLGEVFGDDGEAVALLKQWFGYVLSGRTDLQKMVLWLGPMHGGKGTVARLLKRLVGDGAYAGINVADLRNTFALQSLIGKSLVVFPDERQVGAPDGKRFVQFVLQATGEDDVTIQRKYKDAWSDRLPMRLMYFGNEMPLLPDSSGAVQNRILTIETVASFAGREDRGLDGDLAAELSGILNWALDGLAELQERGELVQPASGMAVAQEVDDLSNHVRRYLRDACRLGEGERTQCDLLWADFSRWCGINGVEENLNAVWFGRQLRPAMRNLSPEAKFERVRDQGQPGRPYYYNGIGLGANDSDGLRVKVAT